MRSIRRLLPSPGGFLASLLAPAEDPRRVFVDARQHREDLLERVREARKRLAGARERLATGVEKAREKLALLDERAGSARTESLARFTRQLRRMAGEELGGLEAQLDELREEEELLPLIEQRIVAELDALRSRDRVLDARHSTADARASLLEAVGDEGDELSDLDAALQHTALRTEAMQARAAAIDRLVGLVEVRGGDAQPSGGAASQLAQRFAREAGRMANAPLAEQLYAGLQSLQRLVFEYEQLKQLLQKRNAVDPLAVARLPALADETYEQGISVLEDALSLALALRGPGESELEHELSELRAQGAQRGDRATDAGETDRATVIERSISSLTDRIAAAGAHRERLDELISHAGHCEAALQRVCIELTEVKATGAAWRVDVVTERLLNTVRQAREVQEELERRDD